jgi:hypothetical protein
MRGFEERNSLGIEGDETHLGVLLAQKVASSKMNLTGLGERFRHSSSNKKNEQYRQDPWRFV